MTDLQVTEEKKKEVALVLKKASRTLLWDGLKAISMLFLANISCGALEKVLFTDPDPDTVLGFRLVCVVVNSLLMTFYFTSKMKEVDDIVKAQIKEILKK
ncbi:MAG TPA: hypothetical protein VIJ14_04915 [Rhabdochlamydiaceae bacterium]